MLNLCFFSQKKIHSKTGLWSFSKLELAKSADCLLGLCILTSKWHSHDNGLQFCTLHLQKIISGPSILFMVTGERISHGFFAHWTDKKILPRLQFLTF